MKTYNDVIRAIRLGVQEYGYDYIDPQAKGRGSCQNYYPETDRFCIAAYVLHALGVSKEHLYDCKFDILGTYNMLHANGIIDWKFDEKALKTLFLAQSLQDRRVSWGIIYDIVYSYFYRYY